MSKTASPQFAPNLPPEEQARADFYALLARLYFAPPDRELLDALVGADEIVTEGKVSALATAWRDLMVAAAALDEEAAQQEYDTLFIGTGKAPVTLYTSAYTIKSAIDNPLVDLRNFLASQGLVRRQSGNEPEDHVAALCETMRFFIAEQHDFAVQRSFFEVFVWPSAGPLCDAIIGQGEGGFYARVARFARGFFELEHNAFEMV